MPKEIPSTVGNYFWSAVRPHRRLFLLAAFVVIVAASLDQGISYIFKIVVDAITVGDVNIVVLAGIGYPILVFVIHSLYRVSGVIISVVQAHIIKEQHDRLINYLMRHSKSYFESRFAGSLVSKVGNVVTGAEEFVALLMWTILETSINLIVTAILIFTVDAASGFVFLGLILTILIVNILMLPEKRKLSEAASEAGSELSGRQADLFSNIDAARQYARNSFEQDRHGQSTTRLKSREFKNWIYTEKMMFVNGFLLALSFAGIMYFLLQAWQAEKISPGDFVLVLSLLAQITAILIFVGQMMQGAARTYGQFQEGLKELVVPIEVTDKPDAVDLYVQKGSVAWQAVTFAYDSQTIFDNLNLDIKPGERIGLVGPSGAGKSTLVSLLLRQHDLTSGAILIDNQNIAEVTQDSLRSNIALVPQEPMLFHRTIAENIMYGKPDATYDEMVTAADRAQAREFIEALPEQYDTLVGERGVKLSGGQKQRVAIARAMLKEAPILVLDEATSALDSESEVAIQKALESLMENKTVIAVAHRLSTLRKMDRILVIDQGKIVEDGTHDSLANAGGLYAKLWEHQAGGFLLE